MTDKIPPQAMEEMRRLYAELAEELSRLDVSCRRCGSCCHFGSSGLFLYISALEASLFFEMGLPPLIDLSGETCPYLTPAGCANRLGRSVGCRTYFCDRKFRDVMEKLHETYLDRVKELSERYGVQWDYMPLSDWLCRVTGKKGR